MKRTLMLPLVLASSLAMASCQMKSQFEDPIGMMTNRSIDPQERMNAAKQAEREKRDDPARIAALETLLYERGYPYEQRRYAIDQLVAMDEAAFKARLAKRISLIVNWDTMKYIFKLAQERKWADLTPTFVRQYARTDKLTPDAERPERDLLVKLNPGKTVEQVVFDVFADRNDEVPLPQQVSAWELLNRLAPPARLMDLLAQAPDQTALVADLKACAADLHTVPTNREGVLWLSYLRDPSRRAVWDSYKAEVAKLNEEQLRGLELRHLSILLCASSSLYTHSASVMSRATLWKSLVADLSNAKHSTKNPTFDGADKDTPQNIQAWDSKLVWGDLLTIWVLENAVKHGLASSLFGQADADHKDESTEHGGVILFAGHDQVYYGKAFSPEIRRHDLKFLSPQDLIEAAYTGLAHYHFHAQSYQNSEYAGPGRGDLEFAKKLNFNCLVFTFTDKDHLNVDYYQPNGAVVDLGTFERPVR